MERPELDQWLKESDEVLKQEELVLEGLKKAVEEGWMTQEELDENITAYHNARIQETPPHLICPDLEGKDL